MRNAGRHKNACNFSIGLVEQPQRQATSVVFGIVETGEEILKMLNTHYLNNQHPQSITVAKL
jgi:hypothetical protein